MTAGSRSTAVLAAAALRSAALPTIVARSVRAAVAGAWLGVLGDDALRTLDELYYERAAVYRTPAWNERGLFPWEEELVGEHFGGRRIGVTGCGGGREVLALLGMGLDAVGYESHPDLAAYGRTFLAERGHPDRIHHSDRDTFAGGPCDAVIAGWGSYSLIHGRARRLQFLADVHRHLPPGGPVLLSVVEQAGGRRDFRSIRTVANVVRRARRAAPVELGDTLAPNRVHAFAAGEVEAELRDAGFDLVRYRPIAEADEIMRHAAAVAVRR